MATIRPFATKKSRLASEKFLLVGSLATESCRLADRLATKAFFKANRMSSQGAWQSFFVFKRFFENAYVSPFGFFRAVFLGQRCKPGTWPIAAPRFASRLLSCWWPTGRPAQSPVKIYHLQPPLGYWYLPPFSPLDTIHLDGGTIVRVFTVSLRGTSVIDMSLFSSGFSGDTHFENSWPISALLR